MTEKYFEESTANLQKLKRQRSVWMKLSSIFVILLFVLAIEWKDLINSNNIYIYSTWAVIIIPICISWWYWTMNLIFILLNSRNKEIEILSSLIEEVKKVKNRSI
jgi:hypothetical protein